MLRIFSPINTSRSMPCKHLVIITVVILVIINIYHQTMQSPILLIYIQTNKQNRALLGVEQACTPILNLTDILSLVEVNQAIKAWSFYPILVQILGNYFTWVISTKALVHLTQKADNREASLDRNFERGCWNFIMRTKTRISAFCRKTI